MWKYLQDPDHDTQINSFFKHVPTQQMRAGDRGPFLGQVPLVETIFCLDNTLFTAPVFHHKPLSESAEAMDFLLIKTNTMWRVEKLPVLFAVGQQQPKQIVPVPNSHKARSMLQAKIELLIRRTLQNIKAKHDFLSANKKIQKTTATKNENEKKKEGQQKKTGHNEKKTQNNRGPSGLLQGPRRWSNPDSWLPCLGAKVIRSGNLAATNESEKRKRKLVPFVPSEKKIARLLRRPIRVKLSDVTAGFGPDLDAIVRPILSKYATFDRETLFWYVNEKTLEEKTDTKKLSSTIISTSTNTRATINTITSTTAGGINKTKTKTKKTKAGEVVQEKTREKTKRGEKKEVDNEINSCDPETFCVYDSMLFGAFRLNHVLSQGIIDMQALTNIVKILKQFPLVVYTAPSLSHPLSHSLSHSLSQSHSTEQEEHNSLLKVVDDIYREYLRAPWQITLGYAACKKKVGGFSDGLANPLPGYGFSFSVGSAFLVEEKQAPQKKKKKETKKKIQTKKKEKEKVTTTIKSKALTKSHKISGAITLNKESALLERKKNNGRQQSVTKVNQITGSERDLRRLTMKEMRQRLAILECSSEDDLVPMKEDLRGLKRWALVKKIRELATASTVCYMSLPTLLSGFARFPEDMTRTKSNHHEQTRQSIFEEQCRILGDPSISITEIKKEKEKEKEKDKKKDSNIVSSGAKRNRIPTWQEEEEALDKEEARIWFQRKKLKLIEHQEIGTTKTTKTIKTTKTTIRKQVLKITTWRLNWETQQLEKHISFSEDKNLLAAHRSGLLHPDAVKTCVSKIWQTEKLVPTGSLKKSKKQKQKQEQQQQPQQQQHLNRDATKKLKPPRPGVGPFVCGTNKVSTFFCFFHWWWFCLFFVFFFFLTKKLFGRC